MASSLPFMQFFPRDWIADERLRLCSLAARGVWFELLCLMHLNESRRGYLEFATGKPATNRQLAASLGTTETVIADALAELDEAGVFSRDENGVIYSRRIVKDAEFRERQRGFGQKRAAGAARSGRGTFQPTDQGTSSRRTRVRPAGAPGAAPGAVQPIRDQSTENRDNTSADQAAESKPAAEPTPEQTPEKKPRKPDPLFDAIADVTGSDPKAAGSHIAKVRHALAGAGYTPADVRAFAARFLELCPWARGERARPELGELQKHIGKLRALPAPRQAATVPAPSRPMFDC